MLLLVLRQLVFASNFVFTRSSLLLAFVLALAFLVKTRLKKASRVTSKECNQLNKLSVRAPI